MHRDDYHPGGVIPGVQLVALHDAECIIAAADARAGTWRCSRADERHRALAHPDTAPDEMQWTGDNAAEMRVWAGVPFLEPQHGRPACVMTSFDDGTHGWAYLEIGDFAVKHQPDPKWIDIGGDYPVRRSPIFTARSGT